MIPAIIIYTDKLSAHELEHVRQWYVGVALGVFAASCCLLLGLSEWITTSLIAGILVHPLAYMLLKPFRLWAEIAAYRKQLKCYADDRSALFAGYISNDYGLNSSVADAIKKLKS